MLKAVCFCGKMAISGSGSQLWDSGSPPILSGRVQGYLLCGKLQSGILEALHTVIGLHGVIRYMVIGLHEVIRYSDGH